MSLYVFAKPVILLGRFHWNGFTMKELRTTLTNRAKEMKLYISPIWDQCAIARSHFTVKRGRLDAAAAWHWAILTQVSAVGVDSSPGVELQPQSVLHSYELMLTSSDRRCGRRRQKLSKCNTPRFQEIKWASFSNNILIYFHVIFCWEKKQERSKPDALNVIPPTVKGQVLCHVPTLIDTLGLKRCYQKHL